MAGVRAGKLRHRVAVERYVKSIAGDRGQPGPPGWLPLYGGVWAALESLDGRHDQVARQQVAEQTHQVTMRYRPGVLPGMRLRGLTGQYAGRLFAVRSVGDGDGRSHFLVLTVTEQRTGATP